MADIENFQPGMAGVPISGGERQAGINFGVADGEPAINGISAVFCGNITWTFDSCPRNRACDSVWPAPRHKLLIENDHRAFFQLISCREKKNLKDIRRSGKPYERDAYNFDLHCSN